MAEVKIIVKSFLWRKNDIYNTSPNVVLIRDGGKNTVVDPGMNREILIDSLKKENLRPEDIDYVVLTHYHLDHSLLTGIFENAIVFDDTEYYNFNGEIIHHKGIVFDTNIQIIKTPGHDAYHCSPMVDTEKGKICIAGDVFFWEDKQEQKTDRESLMNLPDPYMKDKEKLLESRKKILENADYIIPGHGEMFKVSK